MTDYSEANLRGLALQAATLAITAPQDRAQALRTIALAYTDHADLIAALRAS